MRAEKLKVVSVMDPAIDTVAMGVDAMLDYIKTRDWALLKFVPGKHPTVFTIGEIPHDLFESFVMATENVSERTLRCFRAGVIEVQNIYSADDVRQESVTFDRPMAEATAFERFSPSERMEIGQIVWDHCFLPPRIAPTYRLQPSLQSSLERRVFHRAESSQSTQATSNGSRSSTEESPPSPPDATAPESQQSADSSVNPTDVTVTTTA